jgi:hypothetical protein
MNLDDNTTKIIIAIITVITVIMGGAFISIRKTRKNKSKNSISNINISGNNSKVVGGDDNSKNK